MADRHDPIVDELPNKRRKLDPDIATEKAWSSQDDSGEEFTVDDFETAATLPLPPTQKRKLGAPAARLRSTSPPSQNSHTKSSQLGHVTQPTQLLPPWKPSEVQVERSSPIPSDTQSQRPVPAPIQRAPFAKPGGVLASAMAPPGTSFRRPANVQPKPVLVDIDSDDDPPIQHSDDDDDHTQGFSSNIRPTNFKKAGRAADSSPEKLVRESPQANLNRPKNAFDDLLSSFAYNPSSASRPSDDSASAYSSSSRPPRPQQLPAAPARAIPTSSLPQSRPLYHTLEDILDFQLKQKVIRMRNVLGEGVTIQTCMDALFHKKGSLEDAMDHVAQMDEVENDTDELSSLSPVQKKGVAKTIAPATHTNDSSTQHIRPAAKQQVKAPAKTIAEKYRRGSSQKTANAPESDEEEDIKPKRGRLVQRKPTVLSSPPSSPPRHSPPQQHERLQKKKQIITIDSDSEGDGQAFRETSEEPSPVNPPARGRELQASIQELRDERLLKLINDCTAHDLAELSGQPEDTIQFVLDQRPFDSLDSVRAVVQEGLTKTGKKSKKTKPVGDKLVDDCTEVMTGYDAIDELVVSCEKIAQPVQEALRGWGVGDADGELQLMSLDEAHDSGIGTPSSSSAPEDAPAKTVLTNKSKKNKFIGQPSNMSTELTMKNYQLVGLNWLYLLFQKNLSCILADDMGLGKTCQIIAFLSYLQLKKVDGVHLIIVPGSTLENWLREFERFAPQMAVRPYYGSQAEREELRYGIEQDWGQIDAIVTTYDMAVGREDNYFLRKMGPFSVCAYDEAHALRNPKSLRYSQLVRIEADFKVLLTGTPLQNNLQELVAILAFIMPAMFQKKRDDLEYIFKHKASTKDTASAALLSNERIARARTMMTPFILRRKKQQVLDLPTKTSRVEFCDMTDSQANYYADLIEDAQRFYTEKAAGGVKVAAKQSSNVIMSLRKAAIHPLLARRIYDEKKLDKLVSALSKSDEFGSNPPDKIRAYLNGEAAISLKGGDFGLHKFCSDREILRKKFALRRQEWMDSGKVKRFSELVSQFAKNGDRVLVFSQFTTLMDILEAVLEQLNVKFMRLDGSTKMDTRQDMIDKFYEDVSIPVFMLSTRAGGAGINLAAANKVIIFDSGFNPQDDIQAENRAHRVGQTREVEVVRLVTKGTIEEQIHALGESKLALDERVAGEGATAAESKEAEKAGEQMVEKMFVAKMQQEKEGGGEGEGEQKAKAGAVYAATSATATTTATATATATADLKDAFKKGLEGEGLQVASKQAQY